MITGLRQTYNLKASMERIAAFVCEDLEEEGFEPELVKGNLKKPKTWKIENKEFLNKKQQTKFDKIKNKSFDIWRDAEKRNIKEMIKGIT